MHLPPLSLISSVVRKHLRRLSVKHPALPLLFCHSNLLQAVKKTAVYFEHLVLSHLNSKLINTNTE